MITCFFPILPHYRILFSISISRQFTLLSKLLSQINDLEVVLGPSLESNLPKSKAQKQSNVPRDQPQPEFLKKLLVYRLLVTIWVMV